MIDCAGVYARPASTVIVPLLPKVKEVVDVVL
jgi:hypothetical protein